MQGAVFEPFIEARHGQWSPAFQQMILTPVPGRLEALTLIIPEVQMPEICPAVEARYGTNSYHATRTLPGGRIALLVHDSSPDRRGTEYWSSYWRHFDRPGRRGFHCRPCRPR
jgi:hypothetical protein